MKTSEFIRAAVDTCLHHNASEYEYSAGETVSPYLCIAFVHYNAINNYKYTEQRNKVRGVIDELITSMSSIYTTIFTAACDAGIVSEDEFLELEKSDDSQQIRFMLAEFIALQFEDIGD